MNCPGCGYDNKPDALVCNLCQRMLRKAEPRPRPPREQPPPAPAASDVPAVEPTHRRATPWPILALGLVLMLWGTTLIVKRWRTYTLPPYPKNASPAEALTAPGYAYVRWDRALVRKDEVVYRVGHFPAKFVGADPRVGFEAASPSELLAKRAQLTGSYVRVGTVLPMLQSFILTQKRVTTGPGGQDSHEETIGRRIYAPVIGTGARLWVLSKWFPPQVDVAAEPWLVQGAYAGVLRELSHDPEYARLEREWNRSGLGTLPRDAVVLVDEPPHTKDDVARWYPLGPSNELWIEVPDDADLDLSYPEGVVDLPSESGKERETLANYLEQRHGKKAVVPQNLRVIVLATPPEFAKLRNLPGRVSRFGIGVVIVGGLVIGSALRRRRS